MPSSDPIGERVAALEVEVKHLVSSVDKLTAAVTALRDTSVKGQGAWSVVRVAGSLAGGACGSILTMAGGPALAALLPLLSHPAR